MYYLKCQLNHQKSLEYKHRHKARGGHGLLKLHSGPPCPTLLRPADRPPLEWPYCHFWDGPPTVTVFYPFGHPTLYTFEYKDRCKIRSEPKQRYTAWGIQGIEDGRRSPVLQAGHHQNGSPAGNRRVGHDGPR
jgi:hypothetical protein